MILNKPLVSVMTQLCEVEVHELKPKYKGQVLYEGISLKDL